MIKNVRGHIRITEVPDGEAPIWVRKAWVGLIIPVVGITDEYYEVLQTEAMGPLVQGSVKAYLWWIEHDYPKFNECFGFKIRQAEIVGVLEEITPVIRQYVGLLEIGIGGHDYEANQKADQGDEDEVES